MSKYEGMKDIVNRVHRGDVINQDEFEKYNKFIKELSLMLDEVPQIIGQATLGYFWQEVRRIEMCERL